LNSNSADAHHSQAIAFAQSGQYEAAIASETKALTIRPNDVHMIYNRGWSYAQHGDYKSAVDDYTRCLQLQPDLAKAHNSRGNAHFNNGTHSITSLYFTIFK
jgi:Flp pilus assembly protein TadD